MFHRARCLNPSPLLHQVLNQQTAIWSNTEGNHLNACQPPTRGLFMGFSPPTLSRPGVHLTADIRTRTWVGGDYTADSSLASHTGMHLACQPCPSIPPLNQPSLSSQGTKCLLIFQHCCSSGTIILLVSYLHYIISMQSCKEAIKGHKDSPKLGKCRQH